MAVLAGALSVSLWFYFESIVAQEEKQRHTDPLIVERLIQNAQTPWPTEGMLEDNLRWIQVWIGEADGVVGRRPQNQQFADANPTSTEGKEFSKMLARLEETKNFAKLKEGIEARRVVLNKFFPLWNTSAIPQQPGLLPLGKNAQGKWEFWFPAGGSEPKWVVDESKPDTGKVEPTPDMAIVFVLLEDGKFDMGAQRNKNKRLFGRICGWVDGVCSLNLKLRAGFGGPAGTTRENPLPESRTAERPPSVRSRRLVALKHLE